MKIRGTETNQFILEKLGRRVRSIRIGKSMTREGLSQHAGVSFSTITRLESGESISMDNFLKVLYSLNCLQNIDLLLPEQSLTPRDYFNKKQPRVRASRKRVNTSFKWGDEL